MPGRCSRLSRTRSNDRSPRRATRPSTARRREAHPACDVPRHEASSSSQASSTTTAGSPSPSEALGDLLCQPGLARAPGTGQRDQPGRAPQAPRPRPRRAPGRRSVQPHPGARWGRAVRCRGLGDHSTSSGPCRTTRSCIAASAGPDRCPTRRRARSGDGASDVQRLALPALVHQCPHQGFSGGLRATVSPVRCTSRSADTTAPLGLRPARCAGPHSAQSSTTWMRRSCRGRDGVGVERQAGEIAIGPATAPEARPVEPGAAGDESAALAPRSARSGTGAGRTPPATSAAASRPVWIQLDSDPAVEHLAPGGHIGLQQARGTGRRRAPRPSTMNPDQRENSLAPLASSRTAERRRWPPGPTATPQQGRSSGPSTRARSPYAVRAPSTARRASSHQSNDVVAGFERPESNGSRASSSVVAVPRQNACRRKPSTATTDPDRPPRGPSSPRPRPHPGSKVPEADLPNPPAAEPRRRRLVTALAVATPIGRTVARRGSSPRARRRRPRLGGDRSRTAGTAGPTSASSRAIPAPDPADLAQRARTQSARQRPRRFQQDGEDGTAAPPSPSNSRTPPVSDEADELMLGFTDGAEYQDVLGCPRRYPGRDHGAARTIQRAWQDRHHGARRGGRRAVPE